ncbi:hypothetical protein VNI00_013741 [Paramarasmius palmivorus]|uniref:F-box domain-containing protein n=1 Tax=Paramarasmius palmivorus TaxID=297713 RepID=A0AAW0BW28_9AGAR
MPVVGLEADQLFVSSSWDQFLMVSQCGLDYWKRTFAGFPVSIALAKYPSSIRATRYISFTEHVSRPLFPAIISLPSAMPPATGPRYHVSVHYSFSDLSLPSLITLELPRHVFGEMLDVTLVHVPSMIQVTQVPLAGCARKPLSLLHQCSDCLGLGSDSPRNLICLVIVTAYRSDLLLPPFGRIARAKRFILNFKTYANPYRYSTAEGALGRVRRSKQVAPFSDITKGWQAMEIMEAWVLYGFIVLFYYLSNKDKELVVDGCSTSSPATTTSKTLPLPLLYPPTLFPRNYSLHVNDALTTFVVPSFRVDSSLKVLHSPFSKLVMERTTLNRSVTPLIDLYLSIRSFTFPVSDASAVARLDKYIKERPGNYHCPLEHEKTTLDSLLKEAEAELTPPRHECDVNSLASIHAMRHRWREAALVFLKDRVRGMTKPSIRILPDELLLWIFHMCIESPVEDDSRPHSQPGGTSVTIILSRVCSRWRALTLSEPSLWTTIQTDFQGSSLVGIEAIEERTYALIKCCVARSENKPLHIHFDISRLGHGDLASGLHRRTLAEIIKHAYRWKDAFVQLEGGDIIDLPHSLPVLESLRIRRSHIGRPPPVVSGSHIIDTPRLRELEIHVSDVENHILSRLNTRHLIRLTLTQYHFSALPQILGSIPSLVEVKLQKCRLLPTYTSLTSQIITSHIRTLHMNHFCGSTEYLFRSLTLPSLTSLHIAAYDATGGVGRDRSVLIEFLRRSRPPLTELVLQSIPFPPEDLAVVLGLFPSITKLGLGNHSYGSENEDAAVANEALFARLKVNLSTPPHNPEDLFLPNLSSLALNTVDRPVAWSALYEMAQSRCQSDGAGRLHSLQVMCQKERVDEGYHERLSELDEMGLEYNLASWTRWNPYPGVFHDGRFKEYECVRPPDDWYGILYLYLDSFC